MDLKVGDAVLTRPLPSPELPIGARVIEVGPPLWVDVCIMGQHLPQMYRPAELEPLDAEVARANGLCGDCLGYGALETVPAGTGVDEVPSPCANCGGTGRPALRVEIVRSTGTIESRLTYVPHEYVGEGALCHGCGFPRDKGQHDVTASRGQPPADDPDGGRRGD